MHNTRKKHKKYTQTRIRNKRSRGHKHNLIRTRYNVTHKHRGGDGMNLMPSSWVSRLSNPFAKKNETSTDITLIKKAEQQQSYAEQSQKYGNIAQGTILSGVALATTIGNAGVAGLTATGVGIPLAGILAIVLLFANAITNMVITSYELKSVMYDAINILTNCYTLNDYIEFMQKEMKKNQDTIMSSIDNPAINDIKKSIEHKLKELIQFILKISTKEMLQILKTQKKITNETIDENDDAITTIIKQELNNRKKTFAFIDTFTRISDREFYAETTMNKIVRNLTIINGNFLLLKNHFDTTLDYFQRKLEASVLNQFWTSVENEEIFTTYLNGGRIKPQELINDATSVEINTTSDNEISSEIRPAEIT